MTSNRVVQWATGNIGTCALRDVIEHPTPTIVLAGVQSTRPTRRVATRASSAASTS